MPSNKRTASSSISAPNSPKKKPSLQTSALKATPKASLLAGTPATKRKAAAAPIEAPLSPQKQAKTSNVNKRKPRQEDYDNVPYQVECPARPAKKNEAPGSVYRAKDGGDLGLEVDYAVRPGDWGNVRSYGTVKYNDMDFKKGDFAYFAKTLGPPENISDEEVLASDDPLAYERENYYLGMIADARANSAQMVCLRILYAYWPEELPQGRQSYHGMKEVILSNHMDIMDAHTIGSKVKVEQLDDWAERVDGLYWRQTLDITKVESRKKGQPPGVLSKLTGRCRCGQPMNPDKIVYICRHCKVWNHEECLIDDVLERAWEMYQAGTLGNHGEGNAEETEVKDEDSIEVAPKEDEKKSSPLLSMVGHLANKFLHHGSPAPAPKDSSAQAEIGADTEAIAASQVDGPIGLLAKTKARASSEQTLQATGKFRHPGDLAAWDDKLGATIDTTGKYGKVGVAVAQITNKKSDEAVWTTAISCFGCGKKLD